ncbi:MAG: NAD(P)H-dependent oxidoreductase subunit E, partial [bacterium]
MESIDLENFTQELLEKYNYDRSYLIEMAFDIQDKFGYIPKEVLEMICDKLNIFYSEAYSSIFFFKDFQNKIKSKIEIGVCNGTSCYFNGGKELYEKLSKEFENNEEIKIKTSYCYKCCAQYPVVVLNGKTILSCS